MGKRLRYEDMKAVSYVHVGDRLVNTEELDGEQRRRLATALAAEYLSGLYRGEAVFFPAERGKQDGGGRIAASLRSSQ